MPLWLRRTTFNLIREYFEQQNEKAESQQSLLKTNPDKKVSKPDIGNKPIYTTKAPIKK